MKYTRRLCIQSLPKTLQNRVTHPYPRKISPSLVPQDMAMLCLQHIWKLCKKNQTNKQRNCNYAHACRLYRGLRHASKGSIVPGLGNKDKDWQLLPKYWFARICCIEIRIRNWELWVIKNSKQTSLSHNQLRHCLWKIAKESLKQRIIKPRYPI